MYDDVIETRGDYRVRVRYQEGAENPREDYDQIVGVETTHSGHYITTPDPAGDEAIQSAARYWTSQYRFDHAERLLERYIGLHGGVSELDAPHDGPRSVWYLTPDMMRKAGFTDEQITPDRMRVLIEGERKEYRAWADGEVYLITVEKRTEWFRDADPDITGDTSRETWEDVETVGGFIGDEYAREAALEMLDAYAPKQDA